MNYLKLALTWGPPALALIFAGLWWNGRGTISDLRTDKTALTEKLAAADGSLALYANAVADRDATIRQQNASIDAIKKVSDKNRADYELALAAAQKRAYGEQQHADELLALQAPQGELEQCRAARALLEAELVGPGK